MSRKKLQLVWLYPDLMNTYGDRGNVLILRTRAEQMGLQLDVTEVTVDAKRAADFDAAITAADLFFMGGAQDAQQEIVARDLSKSRRELLISKITEGTPGLYICGAYQLLGKEYVAANGAQLPGLGVFDCVTKSAPVSDQSRLIGDIIVESDVFGGSRQLYGFENHGGRTYLGNSAQPLGTVIRGWGNDGTSTTEGIMYQNSIGSYMHGCMLSKNPIVADWLLLRAAERASIHISKENEPTGLLEALSIDVLAQRHGLR